MQKKDTKIKKILTSLMAVIFLLTASGISLAEGLSDSESDGYLQWLFSLEKAIESRMENDTEEGNLLFPFDQPGWKETELRPFRHLSISKSVTELEREYGTREQGRLTSAMVALANARNYVNISEYDSALVWFDAANKLDSEKSFRREIGFESLAAAIAAKDSIAVEIKLLNTLGTSELIGREGELILAYRWLLTNRNSKTIEVLSKKIESQQAVLSDRLRFWHAYAYAWDQQRQNSMKHLKQLIQSGGLSRDLTENQRAWVLAAIPDIFFLEGQKAEAEDLYKILAGCEVESLRLWAEYQISNLEFLRGSYLKAGSGFENVCEAKRFGSWQDQACELVQIARELERIKSEGEPYGTASYYNH